MFLKIALLLGNLSTCSRAQVGAIIVRQGRCISWGYNGAPPGLPHCDENNHGRHEHVHPDYGPCRNATHAEANSIAAAARQGISTDDTTMYTTVSPCDDCSRLIIAAGIVEVVYNIPYRESAGIELLEQAGVRVIHAEEEF